MLEEQIFQKEREIFEQNLTEWRKSHIGKFVLIKDEQICGFFDGLDLAFSEGGRLFGLENFFIEQILPSGTVTVSFFGRDMA